MHIHQHRWCIEQQQTLGRGGTCSISAKICRSIIMYGTGLKPQMNQQQQITSQSENEMAMFATF
jgi:hypothetical protein